MKFYFILFYFIFTTNAFAVEHGSLMKWFHKRNPEINVGTQSGNSLKVKQKINVVTISDEVSGSNYIMSVSSNSSNPDFKGYLFGNKYPNKENKNKAIWYTQNNDIKSNNIDGIYTPKSHDFNGMANKYGIINASSGKYHDVSNSNKIYPVLSLSAFDKIKELHLGGNYHFFERQVISGKKNDNIKISAVVNKLGNLIFNKSKETCYVDKVNGKEGLSCSWRSFEGGGLKKTTSIKYRFLLDGLDESVKKSSLYKISSDGIWRSLSESVSLDKFSGNGTINIFLPDNIDVNYNEQYLKKSINNLKAEVYSFNIKDRFFVGPKIKNFNKNIDSLNTNIFSFVDHVTNYEYINTISHKNIRANQLNSYIYGQKNSPINRDVTPSWGFNLLGDKSSESLNAYPDGYFSGVNDNGEYIISPIGWRNLINNNDNIFLLKNGKRSILNKIKRNTQISLNEPRVNNCHLGNVKKMKGYICSVRSVSMKGYYLGSDYLSIKSDSVVKKYNVNDKWYDIERSIPLISINNTKDIKIFIATNGNSEEIYNAIRKTAFYISEPGYESSDYKFFVYQNYGSIRYEGQSYSIFLQIPPAYNDIDVIEYPEVDRFTITIEPVDLNTTDEDVVSYLENPSSVTINELEYSGQDYSKYCDNLAIASTKIGDMNDNKIGSVMDPDLYCYEIVIKLADDNVVNDKIKRMQFRAEIYDENDALLDTALSPVRTIFDDDKNVIFTQTKSLDEDISDKTRFIIMGLVTLFNIDKDYTYNVAIDVPDGVDPGDFRDRFADQPDDSNTLKLILDGHRVIGGSWDPNIATVNLDYDDASRQYKGSFDIPVQLSNSNKYYEEYGLSASAYDNDVHDGNIRSQIMLELDSNDTVLDGKKGINILSILDNDDPSPISIDDIQVESSVSEGNTLEYILTMSEYMLSNFNLAINFSLDFSEADAADIEDIGAIPIYKRDGEGWSLMSYIDLNDDYLFAINNIGYEADEYKLDIPISNNESGEPDELFTIISSLQETNTTPIEYDPTEYYSDVTILGDLGFEVSTNGLILFDYDIGSQDFNHSVAKFDLTFSDGNPYLFEARIVDNTLTKTDSNASMKVALSMGGTDLSESWVELNDVVTTGSASYQFDAILYDFKNDSSDSVAASDLPDGVYQGQVSVEMKATWN